jgi:molybdopterin converting factor small subunit
MSVKVKLRATFQLAAQGAKTAEVNGKTVAECLKDLGRQHPALEKMLLDNKNTLPSYVTIFVNGEKASDGLSQPVEDGDEIFPMMLIGGG